MSPPFWLSLATLLSGTTANTTVIPSSAPNSSRGQNNVEICTTEGCVEAAASLLQSMDQSYNPCEDFYMYACGKALDTINLPYNLGKEALGVVGEKVQRQLRTVLSAPINESDSNAERVAKTVFSTCMDKMYLAVDLMDSFGSYPLWQWFEYLGGYPLLDSNWESDKAMKREELLGRLAAVEIDVFFSVIAGPDIRDLSRNILWFTNGCVKNTQPEPCKKPVPDTIVSLTQMLAQEANVPVPGFLKQQVNEIVKLSWILSDLAVLSSENATSDQFMTYDEFKTANPWFDWDAYFNALNDELGSQVINIDGNTEIFVSPSGYFSQLGRIFSFNNEINEMILYNYIFGMALTSITGILSSRLQGGLKEEQRWQACVQQTSALDKAVWSLYEKKFGSNETIKAATVMVDEIHKTFLELLDKQDWMDKETRDMAKLKAEAVTKHVGNAYFDHKSTLDEYYKDLEFEANNSGFEAFLEFFTWIKNFQLSQVSEPMNEHVYLNGGLATNAWYSPFDNSISNSYLETKTSLCREGELYCKQCSILAMPSSILLPPVFSPNYPSAVNFGSIGSVIGHELTHAFDTTGSRFDAFGTYSDWWSETSRENYNNKAQCLNDQYNQFRSTILPFDGNQTVSENIADNGGVKLAYKAYQKSKKNTSTVEPRLPGLQHLTNDQIFFLSFARNWCTQITEETLLKFLDDEHSLGPIRVLGVISNSKEFAEAFHCKPGSRSNPEHKCSFW